MHEPSRLTVHRFSTRDVPVGERFDAWAANSFLCDFVAAYASDLPFDAQREHTRLGPLLLARRTWTHPDPAISYDARRTPARIRADQRDFLSFSMQLRGSVALRSDGFAHRKRRGDLYVLDFATPFDREITPGGEISLTVPRDLLPTGSPIRHGDSLAGGMASLFGHYLSHLDDLLPRLSTADLPHVIEATIQLLTATLQPRPSIPEQVCAPIRSALIDRVQRYIDTRLLDPELTPDTICRDVGISRAMLYRLFSHTGGIMREIRYRRLCRVHQILSNRDRPPERIRDIALRHGFTDDKYFIRVFKAQFGHPPSETIDHQEHHDRMSEPIFVPANATGGG